MVFRKESGSAAYSYAAEPKSLQSKAKVRAHLSTAQVITLTTA